jgi:hypothetical protein
MRSALRSFSSASSGVAPRTTSVDVRNPNPTSSEPSSCQGFIDLFGFGDGVGIGECRRLLGQHLLDERAHRLVLGEPEPAPFDEFALGLFAAEADEPRHPAPGHGRGAEIIEHARMREGREPLDGEDAQMLVPQHRRDAAHSGASQRTPSRKAAPAGARTFVARGETWRFR